MKKCEVEDCKNNSKSIGLCIKHYKRAVKKGFDKIKDRSLWIDKIDYFIYETNDALVGKKWGKLELLKLTDKRLRKQIIGTFKCDCGSIFDRTVNGVSRNNIRSCGCDQPKIIGTKKGKLLPVRVESVTPSGKRRYHCICDCGRTINISENALYLDSPCCKSCRPKYMNPRCVGDIHPSFWASKKRDTERRNKSRKNDRIIEFAITMEEAWELFLKQERKCALTKRDIILAPRGSLGTASMDRIDSNKGYTKDNVQWVHKDLNLMKGRLTQELFIEYCREVVNNAPQGCQSCGRR